MGMFARTRNGKACLRLYKTMTRLMLNYAVGELVAHMGSGYTVAGRLTGFFSHVVDESCYLLLSELVLVDCFY